MATDRFGARLENRLQALGHAGGVFTTPDDGYPGGQFGLAGTNALMQRGDLAPQMAEHFGQGHRVGQGRALEPASGRGQKTGSDESERSSNARVDRGGPHQIRVF